MDKIRGNQVLRGTYGEVWIDGDKVFELSKIEANIEMNREDVQFGVSVDSSMTGLKGDFTVGIKKVHDRWNKYLKDMKNGIDVRVEIIAKLHDPNARDGQISRYSLGNCWFNKIPLFNYEKGKLIEEEVTGGFTPTDIQILDEIL